MAISKRIVESTDIGGNDCYGIPFEPHQAGRVRHALSPSMI